MCWYKSLAVGLAVAATADMKVVKRATAAGRGGREPLEGLEA